MAESLYALKRDLDMVVDDVYNLKRSYNLLDYIAKVVRNSELEQLAQAAQMNRMEEEMKRMKEEIRNIKVRLDAVEKRLDAVEKRLDAVENRLESIESMLRLIVNHLGIQPA